MNSDFITIYLQTSSTQENVPIFISTQQSMWLIVATQYKLSMYCSLPQNPVASYCIPSTQYSHINVLIYSIVTYWYFCYNPPSIMPPLLQKSIVVPICCTNTSYRVLTQMDRCFCSSFCT